MNIDPGWAIRPDWTFRGLILHMLRREAAVRKGNLAYPGEVSRHVDWWAAP